MTLKTHSASQADPQGGGTPPHALCEKYTELDRYTPIVTYIEKIPIGFPIVT